jgi:exodeoxyribonuclease V alpha subunit
MLDLPLADHLLRSLPAEGSLVLLGDAQQLPSVEAGAVFRDLVEAPAAAPRVARLTRSWRMDAADPAGSSILGFAGRVAGGALGELDVPRRSASAAALAFAGVELLEGGAGELARFLGRWWSERVLALPDYLELRTRVWDAEDGALTGREAEALAPLMRHLESFRLLSPTRGWSGGTGVAALNAWFRSTLALAAGTPVEPGGEELVAGEPVLVTRNDYGRRLYNGDQGVALAVNVGGRPLAMAAFRRAEGGFRVVPIAALAGRLEPAWATTVHKAQGSEHDAVALVLPAEPGRLLTRELVYTAVTRARRSVVVVGTEAVLRPAVARSVERWSGIGEKLAPAGAASPPPRAGEQLGLPFD